MNIFELNIFLNWIFVKNIELDSFFNWIFVKHYWIEYWIESFFSIIQRSIEFSMSIAQGYATLLALATYCVSEIWHQKLQISWERNCSGRNRRYWKLPTLQPARLLTATRSAVCLKVKNNGKWKITRLFTRFFLWNLFTNKKIDPSFFFWKRNHWCVKQI